MGLEWKVCYTRDNNAVHIWYYIKQQITNELSEQGYCLYIFEWEMSFLDLSLKFKTENWCIKVKIYYIYHVDMF